MNNNNFKLNQNQDQSPFKIFQSINSILILLITILVYPFVVLAYISRKYIFSQPKKNNLLHNNQKIKSKYSEAIISLENISLFQYEKLEWQSGQNSKYLWIVFPGNPGSPYCMEYFCQNIFDSNNKNVDIQCIGHISHTVNTAVETQFTIKDQIQFKLQILQQILQDIPKDQKIILCGHSMGSYIISECIPYINSEQIHRYILLTPTIMNIEQTPNAMFQWPLWSHGKNAFWFLWFLVEQAPELVKKTMVKNYLQQNYSPCIDNGLRSLLNPDVAYQCLHMSISEMIDIQSLKIEQLKKVEEKLVFFYVEGDGWNNVWDYEIVQRAFKNSRVIFNQEGHEHCFVLSQNSTNRVVELAKTWV